MPYPYNDEQTVQRGFSFFSDKVDNKDFLR